LVTFRLYSAMRSMTGMSRIELESLVDHKWRRCQS
jgi:hypothetical protein